MRDSFRIRRLYSKVTLEIKDVDPTVNKEEAKEILRAANCEAAVCKVLRSAYIGTQLAGVECPTETARNLVNKSKIRIE